MIDFAYIDGNSYLHKLDPTIKFIGLILASVIILVTRNLPGLIVSIGIISLLAILSKLPIQVIFLPLKRLYWFLAVIFLMNSLFYTEGECLFSFWIICISKAGIMQGFNIFMHTAAITVISSLYIRTTTSMDMMRGIETMMRPLRLVGVPTRDIALIMSIAMQFIPVFFSDIDRIRKAQIARGADFSGGSLKDKARAIFPLVIPAFISAFRRADDLSLAIEARGYQSERESLVK